MTSDKPTNRIYLDYASTTPLDTRVLKKMMPYFDRQYGNPSSLHASGRRAHRALTEARASVASVIHASPHEIVFTGSGTESDALAVIGVARAYRTKGKHIIISSVEHKAVRESAHSLEKEGFRVSVLPVDMYGNIDIETCLQTITPETTLISVMYANNEIGTIQPIAELSRAIREYKNKRGSENSIPLLHTDACQCAGYESLDVRKLGVDLMTLNGSKIYGPKGIGMLYVKNGVHIEPLIHGGDQEHSIRAGTENIPFIVGFAEALKRADAHRVTESRRLVKLRDYFIKELQKKIPNIVLNGHPHKRLPNNIHISIPSVEGESILLMLDAQGIEVSTGSACSAHDLKPSHVLLAIGQNPDIIHGSIRFSLGKHTIKKELAYVLSILPEIIEKLRNISAVNH